MKPNWLVVTAGLLAFMAGYWVALEKEAARRGD